MLRYNSKKYFMFLACNWIISCKYYTKPILATTKKKFLHAIFELKGEVRLNWLNEHSYYQKCNS